nr:MAG TPA: hypothetical protein [Caudoviricetes sp.]
MSMLHHIDSAKQDGKLPGTSRPVVKNYFPK